MYFWKVLKHISMNETYTVLTFTFSITMDNAPLKLIVLINIHLCSFLCYSSHNTVAGITVIGNTQNIKLALSVLMWCTQDDLIRVQVMQCTCLQLVHYVTWTIPAQQIKARKPGKCVPSVLLPIHTTVCSIYMLFKALSYDSFHRIWLAVGHLINKFICNFG